MVLGEVVSGREAVASIQAVASQVASVSLIRNRGEIYLDRQVLVGVSEHNNLSPFSDHNNRRVVAGCLATLPHQQGVPFLAGKANPICSAVANKIACLAEEVNRNRCLEPTPEVRSRPSGKVLQQPGFPLLRLGNKVGAVAVSSATPDLDLDKALPLLDLVASV